MGVRRSVLGLVGLAAGCNAVHGLDPTVAVDEHLRTVVFDNSASKIDLVDFPVLVALDAARIDYDEVTDPRTDLRFFDPDTGQDLPFEIERWDPAGRSELWVKVPQIDARSTTDAIQMFFGAEAGGVEQGSGVWSAYAFVYHGHPGKPASSVGTFPGMAENVTYDEGAIGSAPRFTPQAAQGDFSAVEFLSTDPLLDGWDTFTLELWIYPDYESSLTIAGEPRFFEKGGTFVAGRLLPVVSGERPPPGLIWPQIDMHFQAEPVYLHPEIRLRAWGYSAYTFEGRNLWVYRNGAAVYLYSFDQPTRLVSDPGPVVLGTASGNNAMAGLIDEVRISPDAKPADWVKAQYMAMTGRFVTFAAGVAP